MTFVRGDRTLHAILAPIQHDLDHPSTTDVVVNKPHQVGVRQNGQWTFRHIPSFDLDTLDAATILIGQRTGREFDEANPYVNSTTPGGHRFQGVRPPGTSANRLLWAIRRPPSIARQFDDDDFDELTSEVNTMTSRLALAAPAIAVHYRNKDWRPFFKGARMGGLSIGFCGGMGDGKSDMVRRSAQVYRPHSRMVTIETDEEMGDTGPDNKAPLLYDDTKMKPDEAVRIAKRLAAQEIVIQEVRGAEAWSMLVAMNSGASGLTTWHADEGREVESLADMARQHLATASMKDEVLMDRAGKAFDVIAYCRRNDVGRFRISSVRLKGEPI